MKRIINSIVGMILLCMVASAHCAGSEKIVFYSFKNSKTRIGIIKGDITKQQGIDVIVNAANEQLQHGGGVAAAISKAAGPQLQIHCDNLPKVNNVGVRCATGRAVLTPAFNLNKIGIKGIIHAVGPRVAQKKAPTPTDEKLLYDAYTNSLKLAAQNKMRSIAFPAISTAIFNYDIKYATPVAIRAVCDFIKRNPNAFDEVRFVLFLDQDFAVYEQLGKKLLHRNSHKSRVGKRGSMVNEPTQIENHGEKTKTEKNKVGHVVQLTWSQWIGKHPYITAVGSISLAAGLIYGVYSICK